MISTNWDSQLAKSLFQTRSRVYIMQKRRDKSLSGKKQEVW
ncbi:DUF6783 domain-containing protein [Fusicatenibacter saccharivorans]